MPKLYFLEADKPLTKTFSPTTKSSYPNVYEVTSHEVEVHSISDLAPLLEQHGHAGRCLLKGALARPLVRESRAGSTNPAAPTQWLCLDLDDVDMQNTDVFMSRIGLGDVSYVRQWSASHGVYGTPTKLRCHIFVFLAAPTTPAHLKQCLMHLNFTVPELSSGLELTSTDMALKWTLDITTCQEDKLLYIAPPILEGGLVDPYPGTTRYEFVQKAKLLAPSFQAPSEAALRATLFERISKLREAKGLTPRKKWETKRAGTIEYLVKPDQATITEIKKERDFVYFNLNGGDSWAYYHPAKNPYYIYNFKGEPIYRTEDLLPAYWTELKHQANTGTPDFEGTVYLAFRDFHEDRYYNAIYHSATDDLVIAGTRGVPQLRDFMVQHGQIMPEYVPDWNRMFDPSSNVVIDPAARTINTFKPSEVMKKAPKAGVTSPPAMCDRVVTHMVGGDPATRDWVYNWLAFIVQYRQMSGAALVCHGTSGTGKGLFFHKIVTPLLGEHNVVIKRLEEIESEFTGWIENSLFVFVDEVQTSSSLYHSKINAKLKSLITEPSVSVRKMYTPVKTIRNYSNYMFASNKLDPVEVDEGDRRYTVGFRQPTKLNPTLAEVQQLEGEIEDFYGYLMGLTVDVEAATKPLPSGAKQLMVEVSRTSVDAVVHALNEGDLAYFVDALPADDIPDQFPRFRRNQVMQKYVKWIDMLVKTKEDKITRDELQMACRWCVGAGIPDSPHKFTSMLRHHNVNMIYVWRGARSVRGITVKWNAEDSWLQSVQTQIAPLVDRVSMEKY